MTLTQRQPSPLPRRLSNNLSMGLSEMEAETHSPSIVTESPSTPHYHITPVPYLKLFPLLIQRWSEGVTYGVIFPYINEMIHSMGMEEKSVGVWSATAESVMMVTESLSAPIYAPLADRFGRRPVLIVLEIMWGVFGVAFGFSSTVWAVIILRGCLGLLAGCGVISRTMVGEMCDRTNRIKGFAVFSPAFIVGMTTAPLVGGLLANPVPHLLPASWTLFSDYPYLLPALAAGLSAIIAAWMSISILPETLDRSKHKQAHSLRGKAEGSSSSNIIGLLKYKKFQQVLTLYGLQNAIAFSFEAVFPLFGFTNKEFGGLGISTQKLGIILGCSAALSIFMTIFVFPVVHSSMPENYCLLFCLSCYPLATIFFPVMWSLNFAYEGDDVPLSVWIVMSIHMILRRFGDFASIQLDTITLDAIPGPEYLATANSLGFSISAAGRAIGPFIISWFFSISTGFSPYSPGMQLVWIVMVLLTVPSLVLAYQLGGEERHQGKSEHGYEEEQYELIGNDNTRVRGTGVEE
ncbi:hypothetical protein I312_105461 [Cryptococcus bacillisporus CA1280]|uniref:Major facilitator superfamily (MFS) profile domain-containing protein n=1 Tax=Cryptococcus bacillisporus CA1280 TaxID=1296109 RepID=A0A0D0VNE1_CRYGA|nr:hypothetical protein I312_03048 [Cryptococcus bacillisporus CA1280]